MSEQKPDLAQVFAPWLERHKRPAWIPVVEDGDGPITVSKFAGVPWLAAKESWPTCGNCKEPMRFFVQVNLATIPKELEGRFGDGLLQLFVCLKEQCIYGEAYGHPFSECLLVRIVQPNGSARDTEIPSFDDECDCEFPAKRISGWQQQDDYPNSEDFSELGLLYSFERIGTPPNVNSVERLECKELGFSAEIDFDEFLELDKCIEGEKLAGWADWVQIHTSYPNCPKCNRRMDTIVFQIGSDGNIPFMFSDGGQGPITQCPVHKEVLGFSWDCG